MLISSCLDEDAAQFRRETRIQRRSMIRIKTEKVSSSSDAVKKATHLILSQTVEGVSTLASVFRANVKK
jgi:DNA-directed RNA polymerase subunit L